MMDTVKEFGLTAEQLREQFENGRNSCYKCGLKRVEVPKYKMPFEDQLKHREGKGTDIFLWCLECDEYTHRPDIINIKREVA